MSDASADKPHVHAPEHTVRFESGRTWEGCSCGASRFVSKDGRAETWHTCKLCTHPWGLP